MVQAEAFAQDFMQIGHNAGMRQHVPERLPPGRLPPQHPAQLAAPGDTAQRRRTARQGLGALPDPAPIVVNGLVAAREGLLVKHILDHNVAGQIEQILLVLVHALHLLGDGRLRD